MIEGNVKVGTVNGKKILVKGMSGGKDKPDWYKLWINDQPQDGLFSTLSDAWDKAKELTK